MAEAKSQLKHEESTFKTKDGLNLFQQRWQPIKQEKAVVVIIHGYAEHIGRYAHVDIMGFIWLAKLNLKT